MIIDLTPVRDGTGPARLLDMVEIRSKAALKDWLAEREDDWRQGVKVVAMDGFSGFKTATTEELPEAIAVMDHFHVVRLPVDALDECRRRSSSTPAGTAATRAIRCIPRGGPCTPGRTCSPRSSTTG